MRVSKKLFGLIEPFFAFFSSFIEFLYFSFYFIVHNYDRKKNICILVMGHGETPADWQAVF